MSSAIDPARVYRYRIDFEGRILHQGSEITDPAVVRQLLRTVHRDADGTCFSLCMGERNELVADDVLYVIASFDATPVAPADRSPLRVRCQGGLERSLDLATLGLHGEAHLYGDVEGGLSARFGRQAWLELASRHVQVDGAGAASLSIGGRWFPIARRPVGGEAAKSRGKGGKNAT